MHEHEPRAQFTHMEDGTAEGEPIAPDTSLRDTLSLCLWRGCEALPVADGDTPLGRVTLATIRARAAELA